jgi:hypothetical protein
MDVFFNAMQVYSQSQLLVDATRDASVVDDLLRWMREDLSEAAWDMKLAVIDGDAERTSIYLSECLELMTGILLRLKELDDERQD